MTQPWNRIDAGTLLIAGQPISLPHPVKEVLHNNDRLLILVEPPPDVIFNRNVFALSMHGERLWQIEESPHGAEVDKPYINLHCDKNGLVIAGNWNGLSYSVDLRNGAVSIDAFEK